MSDVKKDCKIGYGKPRCGRPVQKGQSGNPLRKDLSPLIAVLNEPVYATINGKRRKITKREAIIKQMVDKSAGADLRATKMAGKLAAVGEGRVRRSLVIVPPRHLKSHVASVSFPA